MPHHPEVVGYKEVGQPESFLKLYEKVDNLGLYGDVERRYGLVADDELGVERERPRDGYPLPLPPAEFVRVARQDVFPEPDRPQELADNALSFAGEEISCITSPSATMLSTFILGLSEP